MAIIVNTNEKVANGMGLEVMIDKYIFNFSQSVQVL